MGGIKNKKSHWALGSAYWHPAIAQSGKTLVLGVVTICFWYVFMIGLMGWYKPEFLLLASVSSVVMIALGKSWGIAERIID